MTARRRSIFGWVRTAAGGAEGVANPSGSRLALPLRDGLDLGELVLIK
jgi:hypothetical protein